MFEVLSQSFMETVHDPLLEIPNWLRTFLSTPSLATSMIIWSPAVMRVTPLRYWLRCTTSSRWTHNSGLLTLRWETLAFFGCRYQQLQGLIQIWNTTGTYDQLNLGGVAAMEELARQIQGNIDSRSDLDNVSWSDVRLDSGSQRAAVLRWHIDRRIEQSRGVVVCGGTGDGVVAPGGKVQPLGAGKAGRGRAGRERFPGRDVGMKAGDGRAPATGEMTSLLAVMLVPSCGALWRVSRFLEVLEWRCRARLPNVLVSFLKYVTTVRPFVVGSLLVKGPSWGKWSETILALKFLETGGTVDSESCDKVVYSILSTGLASRAFRRLHLVISAFRPPSVAESAEAVLRRLLASRAIGGYSLTSDVLAPGSPTVFQSSQAARPQDTLRAPYHVSLLSSSVRSYLNAYKRRMLRPVSEVADMETRLRSTGRCVDPVFQHSRRRCVGFVRDMVRAGSVEFVEGCSWARWSLFVARKAGVKRFFVDARAGNRHFSRPPAGPLLTGEGLCHVEFHWAHEDAHSWFVGSADINNALHQMRIPNWLHALFCTARCPRTWSWLHRKSGQLETSLSLPTPSE